MSKTAQRIIAEIETLPEDERDEVIVSVSALRLAKMIPQDFIEALDDFERAICADGNGSQRNSAARVSYQYRAVEKFWRNFHALNSEQKESVRRAWSIFKTNPFHPSLGAHEIRVLSSRAKHTIYSVVIEADLRVLFRIDESAVTSLDVGTHKIYR